MRRNALAAGDVALMQALLLFRVVLKLTNCPIKLIDILNSFTFQYVSFYIRWCHAFITALLTMQEATSAVLFDKARSPILHGTHTS